MLTPELSLKILQWQNKAKELEVIKAEELALRLEVFKMAFASPKEGMNNFDLGNGYTLKAEHKYNYNLSESKQPRNGGEPFATTKALNAIEALGNEGKFLAERVVNWKPELSIKEYRDLDQKYKALIDKALTITPGTPSLKIDAPVS